MLGAEIVLATLLCVALCVAGARLVARVPWVRPSDAAPLPPFLPPPGPPPGT